MGRSSQPPRAIADLARLDLARPATPVADSPPLPAPAHCGGLVFDYYELLIPGPHHQRGALPLPTGRRCSRGSRWSDGLLLPEPKPPAIRTGRRTVVDLLRADPVLQHILHVPEAFPRRRLEALHHRLDNGHLRVLALGLTGVPRQNGDGPAAHPAP